MTMYARTSDGQIHADFARRAAKVLHQYEACSAMFAPHERYESTLAVSLLQSLLTALLELSDSEATRPELEVFLDEVLGSNPNRLGLEDGRVVCSWRHAGELTNRRVLTAIRNSLSHPTPQYETRWPTTGFVALQTGSGLIEGYRFAHSPWVAKGGQVLDAKFCPSKKLPGALATLERAVERWRQLEGDHPVGIEVRGEQFVPVFKGDVFVPFIEVTLRTPELRAFTLAVAALMAGE